MGVSSKLSAGALKSGLFRIAGAAGAGLVAIGLGVAFRESIHDAVAPGIMAASVALAMNGTLLRNRAGQHIGVRAEARWIASAILLCFALSLWARDTIGNALFAAAVCGVVTGTTCLVLARGSRTSPVAAYGDSSPPRIS